MIWNIFIGLVIAFLFLVGGGLMLLRSSVGFTMVFGGLILLIMAVWPARALEGMI